MSFSGLASRTALRARLPAGLFGGLRLRTQPLSAKSRPVKVLAHAAGGAAAGSKWPEWCSFINKLAKDNYLVSNSGARVAEPDETGLAPAFGEAGSCHTSKSHENGARSSCIRSGALALYVTAQGWPPSHSHDSSGDCLLLRPATPTTNKHLPERIGLTPLANANVELTAPSLTAVLPQGAPATTSAPSSPSLGTVTATP